MGARGHTGKLMGVPVAIEFNGDGSVNICKEILEEMLQDQTLPEWMRKLLSQHKVNDLELKDSPGQELPF